MKKEKESYVWLENRQLPYDSFLHYHTVIGENIVESLYFIREKHEKVKENSRKKEKNAKKDKKKIPLKIKNMQHDDKKSNMRVS